MFCLSGLFPTQSILGSYGEAPGVVCSDILYVADMYAGDIFPLTGALRNDFVYEMKALEKSE